MGAIDMSKVESAAKIANAEEFIKMLPGGYNSYVGQKGSSLSGGQKQRLSIARAIYQNSSVLILDEATSALDSRSEILVKEALTNLMANHTVRVGVSLSPLLRIPLPIFFGRCPYRLWVTCSGSCHCSSAGNDPNG